MIYYAGIGSRETPQNILLIMEDCVISFLTRSI